jgi:hypothetical protein
MSREARAPQAADPSVASAADSAGMTGFRRSWPDRASSPEAALASFMSGPPRWQRLMEGGLVDVSRAGGVWTTLMGAGVEQPACPPA